MTPATVCLVGVIPGGLDRRCRRGRQAGRHAVAWRGGHAESAPTGPGVGVTRVLLVDDHAMVRAGLAALLGAVEHLEVVAQASNGLEAVELAARLRPDVVLMDMSMPVLDGVAATRRIVTGLPGIRVVMLTSFTDRRRVREAMSAGAVGYLVKDCDPHEIIAAVRAAARGEAPVDPRVAGALRTPPAPAAAAARSGVRARRHHRAGLWRRPLDRVRMTVVGPWE